MTANQEPWVGLRLDPLDTLFFRDGRPFDAAARVLGGLPTPQTLAGALRTALLARSGFRFDHFATARKEKSLPEALRECRAPQWVTGANFRGPWLALVRTGKPIEPLLPLPANLASDGADGWLRSEPREQGIPGWTDPERWPLWRNWREGKPDTKAGGGFLTLTSLKAFLAGDGFGKGKVSPRSEFFHPDELYDFDHRVGIGVDMDKLTSAEGAIYGIGLLALRPVVRGEEHQENDPYHRARVCLYAEILPGAGAPAALTPFFTEPLPLGGEGKNVRAEETAACLWPAPGRGRTLWYLAAPAFFQPDPSSPRLHDGLKVRAAASGTGVAVSGWDVARNGPRPTRFAVPGGAVYFVEGTAPAAGPFRLDEDDRAEGWGFALPGIW
jgi:CRISPR-associated protein Cmr3